MALASKPSARDFAVQDIRREFTGSGTRMFVLTVWNTALARLSLPSSTSALTPSSVVSFCSGLMLTRLSAVVTLFSADRQVVGGRVERRAVHHIDAGVQRRMEHAADAPTDQIVVAARGC